MYINSYINGNIFIQYHIVTPDKLNLQYVSDGIERS
jgi:hypothetical protein